MRSHDFWGAIGGVTMLGTPPKNSGDCAPSILIYTSNTNTNASGWGLFRAPPHTGGGHGRGVEAGRGHGRGVEAGRGHDQ